MLLSVKTIFRRHGRDTNAGAALALSTGKRWRTTRIALLFLLPFLVLYTIFTLFPIVQGFWISLHNWEIMGTNIRFVGLENYTRILQDDQFWGALGKTFQFVVLVSPTQIVLGLILALMVNRHLPGAAIFRGAFYVPVLISVTVIGIIWTTILGSTDTGLLNTLITPLFGKPIAWFQEPSLAMPAVVITSLWWSTGGSMLIFLAALQDVPQELYDAAKVDGASGWRLFRHITLPGIRRASTFIVVLTLIGAFQVFGQIDVMTKGGPAGSTRTIVYYIYERAFVFFQLGWGSAAAFLLFILLFGLSVTQLWLFSRGDN